MSECLFSSYYLCSATKPFVGAASDGGLASNDNTGLDLAHRIAAE
jgi:hypothetical protein